MSISIKQFLINLWTLLGFFLFIFLTIIFCLFVYIFRLNGRHVRTGFYYLSKMIMGMVRVACKSFAIEYQAPIPAGPAIIIANHSSILDILCFSCLNLKDIVFIGKSWPFKIPFMGYCVKRAGNILAGKNVSFDKLLEQAKNVFNQNLKLVIFPEGTRSTDGKIHRFHTGAFAIAQELNVPLIPIALIGLGKTIRKNSVFVKPEDIKIIVMPPCHISKEESRLNFAQRLKKSIINTMGENI